MTFVLFLVLQMEEKLKAFESDNISLRADVSCLRLQNEKVFSNYFIFDSISQHFDSAKHAHFLFFFLAPR